MAAGGLGDALSARMTALGLRQREAAAQLGVSQQTLSKWMTGVHQPGATAIASLAAFLDCPEAVVRELLVPPDPQARRTANRRISEIEARRDEDRESMQRILMRLTSLLERLETLETRVEELRRERL